MKISRNEQNAFKITIQKIIRFLDKEKISYFVLGGLAVGVMGEPRFTHDIDLDIFLEDHETGIFIKRLKKASFVFSAKQAMENVSRFGTFRLFFKKVQIDIIIASTDLEKMALKRKKRVNFFGQNTCFPSAEDLILLKLIAGRPKDILDVESVAIRQKGKLDVSYLENWAHRICEEAEDFRILKQLKKILA